MSIQPSPAQKLPFKRGIVVLSLGVGVGLAILSVSRLETKWLVYVCAAFIFIFTLVVVRDRERLLWGLFILSFQFDVSVRLLYGHAGSAGLAFPLTFFAAVLVLGRHAFSGELLRQGRVIWGGRQTAPIIVIFATTLLSLALSSETFNGVSYLLTHLQYYLIYLIALNFLTTNARFQQTVALLLVSLGIQSLIYYIQSALGITFTLTGAAVEAGALPRPGGTVSTTPAGFASFIIPILMFSIAHFISREPGTRRRIAGIIAIMGICALVLTLTRAAWGSFVLGLSWLVFISYRRNALSAQTMLLIIAAVVATAMIFTPMILARLEGSPLEGSYQERANLMRIAMIMISNHPFLGVGPGAYEFTYRQYIPPDLEGWWLFTVHNYYLLRTAETGIVGGLAFILLLFTGFLQALRISRSPNPVLQPIALGIGSGIVALSFEMYWDTWTGFPYNALLWFLLGMLGAAERMLR